MLGLLGRSRCYGRGGGAGCTGGAAVPVAVPLPGGGLAGAAAGTAPAGADGRGGGAACGVSGTFTTPPAPGTISHTGSRSFLMSFRFPATRHANVPLELPPFNSCTTNPSGPGIDIEVTTKLFVTRFWLLKRSEVLLHIRLRTQ